MSAIRQVARVAIFHAAARRADELREAVDPALQPSSDAEHITRLVASLGCVACSDAGDDLAALLVEHMADVLLYADDLERERRAA